MRLEVADGDRFVICSDGLTKELTDYGILHFLPCSTTISTEAADDMLEAALENGGRDNVTIIVLNAHRTTSAATRSDASASIDSSTTGL